MHKVRSSWGSQRHPRWCWPPPAGDRAAAPRAPARSIAARSSAKMPRACRHRRTVRRQLVAPGRAWGRPRCSSKGRPIWAFRFAHGFKYAGWLMEQGYRFGINAGLSVITLFPMIILTMTIERMALMTEEFGAKTARRTAFGSWLLHRWLISACTMH